MVVGRLLGSYRAPGRVPGISIGNSRDTRVNGELASKRAQAPVGPKGDITAVLTPLPPGDVCRGTPMDAPPRHSSRLFAHCAEGHRYASPVIPLRQLLQQAEQATPAQRIDLRDSIAAHGTDALPLVSTWLARDRLGLLATRLTGHAARARPAARPRP